MADESEQIKNLYAYSATLDDAGQEAGKHVDLYKVILNGAKGGNKLKSLSAQLVPRYFKYFPDLLDEGINALTDLCEEEDMKIRVLAVRAFPGICKDTPSVLSKAADILGQLLQTEIQVEQDNVRHSLIALLKIDAKAVINALFNQIVNRDEVQREKAIQFLKDKVYPLKEEILAPHEDVERALAEHIKKASADVSGEEFKIFMEILSGLTIYKGANAKELIELLEEQADLKSDFKATEIDNVERLLSCMNLALPFLQRETATSSHGFLNYLATKVLPSLNELQADQQTRLLQTLAEMSPFASADDARLLLPILYGLFQSHVPTEDSVEKLLFTSIEALLFSFHHLGSKAPGAVSALCGVAPVYTGQPSDMVTVENAETKLKNFHSRLKLLETKSESFFKELNVALKSMSQEKDKEKYTAAVAALKTTKNIQDMVKPLLKQKPVFYGKTSGIQLSWQKENKRKRVDVPMKQTVVSTQEGSAPKKFRGGFQGVYTPPARREVPPPGIKTRGGRGGGGVGNRRGSGRGRGRGGRF